MRFAFLLALIGAVVLCAAAPAEAAAVGCRTTELNEGAAEPLVRELRALNQPPKTDFYASPCLVARTLARGIRTRRPRRVEVRGLNWDGGFYRCAYARRARGARTYTAVRCRRLGKPRRSVTLRLVAQSTTTSSSPST